MRCNVDEGDGVYMGRIERKQGGMYVLTIVDLKHFINTLKNRVCLAKADVLDILRLPTVCDSILNGIEIIF